MRRRPAALLAQAALVTLATGCAPDAPPTRPLNLLLVSIDALRADGLSAYGNPRPTSPFLDQLAGRGTRFSNAYVATYGTTASHATILSGTYQETHRVAFAPDDGPQPRTVVPDHLPWLPSLLAERGYHTVAVTDGGNVGAEFGFARGFAVHDDRGGGIGRRTRRALQLLDARPDERPFFLFFHTYEVHSPYVPPRDLRGRFGHPEARIAPLNPELLRFHKTAHQLPRTDLDFLRARYDEEIVGADRALARFYGELETRGLLDTTLVVVTADHGEEFGEHGGLLHRGTLHDELLHVPLLVSGPRLPVGRVDDQLVSSVDLAPSILATLGQPAPATMQGDARFGPSKATPARSLVAQYGAARYAARTADWKLIEHRVGGVRRSLYALADDPGEHTDVAAEHPQRVAELSELLERFRRAHPPSSPTPPRPADLDARDLRKLEALGYVDGG